MSSAGEAVVLKADVVGRVRRSRAQREQLLNEFDRSCLSGPQFAALAGVKYQTFDLRTTAQSEGLGTNTG